MTVTGRILVAAFTICLVAVWTCPAYCSTMAGEAANAAPAADMTGHEHHHTSEMSMPLDGAALTAIHTGCCEHCGADQVLSTTEKSVVALKSSSVLPTLLTPATTRALVLAHVG